MALFSANENYIAIGTGIRRLLRRYVRDRRGNIAAITALLIVPLVGIMGVATETSGWFLIQRSMQNAADSAAIAAATNGVTNPNGVTYITEANSVTTNLGFTNAANNTTVAVVNTDNTVPAVCNSACYKVTISRKVPFYLGRIVGYTGNTTINGNAAVTVSAFAVVRPPGQATGYCLVGLGTSGNAITLSGGNGTDLTGCDMSSASGLKCNGINSDFGVNYGDAVGTSNCGVHPRSGQPAPNLSTYNYTTNASLLGSPPYNNTCGAAGNYFYIGSPGFANKPNNNITGNVDWSGQAVHIVCGDLQVTGNTTITTASPGTVLIIENGQLNIAAGATLNASGLTIVFSGTATDTHSKFTTGGGTLNYSAPTTGTWSGIALYQDPALPNSNPGQCNGGHASDLDFCAAGNSPHLDITGLIYAPNAQITVTGAINHQQNGFACLSIIAQSIVISGTNAIFANPTQQCNRAGLTLPGVPGTQTRLALIQ